MLDDERLLELVHHLDHLTCLWIEEPQEAQHRLAGAARPRGMARFRVDHGEDLARRDLTVNAMARDADGQLIDPFGGSEDLNSRTLRHVSAAFTEDPVRILRVAKFAARFSALGFAVADETLQLMNDMVRSGEKVSRSFEVDNTPPRVESLTATPGSDDHTVRFVAKDDISPIRNVEYSVNSGRWNVVFPVDGIADSLQEDYDFQLDGYRDGGVYTLVVKLSDNLGNTATARVELR